jgi:hypothetical protein
MKKIFLLGFVAAMFFAGCAKEENDSAKGCMDQTATNYNKDATEDCCCEFSGRLIFYYGQAASIRMISQNSQTITLYVGETTPTERIGSYPTSKYWNGVPPCGSDGTMTVQRNLGTAKTKSFKYMIVDDLGREIWKGTAEWKATTGSVCTVIELK